MEKKRPRVKEKSFESPEDLDAFMSEPPDGDDIIPDIDDEGDMKAPAPKIARRREEPAAPPAGEGGADADMLDVASDVPVQVIAVMGKKNITLKELAMLKLGSVLELNRPANEVVDLIAGGKLVAKGELVEIEGKLGVRIAKMMK